MRILFVCEYYKPAFSYGGPVNSIASLCESLVRSGTEVSVFTTNANKNSILDVQLREPINVDGVPVCYFPLFSNGFTYFFSPSLINAVFSRIRDFDITVAEGLWGLPLVATGTSATRYNIPYVVPIRGQFNPWALASKGLKKKVYLNLIARYFLNRASGILCQTALEAEYIKVLGIRAPRLVIPSGLNTSEYTNLTPSNIFRQKFGIQDQALILLFLSRITRIKRPDIAVDTLASVQSMGKDVHLFLAGPDEDGLVPELRAQALSLGCAEKVHFLGLLDRVGVLSVLAEVNLMLMPTEIQENFGNSAMEALAAGVPILVSENVPVGQWAQQVGGGRAVVCTKEAFRQVAGELIHNPKQLKEMGKNGQGWVRKNFDMEVVTRKVLDQFQSIILTGQPLMY